MAKIAISARGEQVDFDLLTIKQQLASAQAPIQVTNRQNYIDQKFGRSLDVRPVTPNQVAPNPVVAAPAENADWNVLSNPEAMSDEQIRAQFKKEKK